jgi:serine/threonine protein kinase
MAKAGRYHIARKIADGGMAEIFLGTQHGVEGFERPVVLKRILAPLVADPQFRNMLIDEAHVAMGLNHSNIVQVLDLGHVHDRYFLVLELVDGWDLSQILARASSAAFPVPPEIVLYIAAEICRALAYAHSRTRDGQPLALVHRDVSPQNVLISEQGEVKLTDFGIAKAMGRREHTSQGVIKGKLAFMSPEQASGKVLDNRSDLFALGTMLYQFFVGKKPFDAPTDLESIMRVRECRFTPPEEVKPGLHPELVQIIRRAMQAKPSDRYQSADEMLLAIENVQRTAYKPAGQTELTRWLRELQDRDGCASISRTESPRAAVSLSEELDVGVGADVVFDESNVMDISEIMRGTQPTVAVAPETFAIPDEKSGANTAMTAPPAMARGAFPTRIIVLVMLAAVLAVGAWLTLHDQSPAPAKQAKEPRAKRLLPAAAAKPTPPAVLDAGTDRGAEAAALVHAEPPVTAPAQAEEEEEEALLEKAEPNDDERVIGENEGVVGRKPVKSSKATTAPNEPVSVRVASSPPGAVVSLNKRVFGRAPLNLRFRPGLTFELTFVKKGYLPATKRFAVTGKKNQSVTAVLKKKPEKKPGKKSLFHRIFGGK